jgi:hypothetical protein
MGGCTKVASAHGTKNCRAAERKDRIRMVVRNAGLVAVWLFVMWLGFSSISLVEKHDVSGSGVLTIYVLFTAIGVAIILDKLWKGT